MGYVVGEEIKIKTESLDLFIDITTRLDDSWTIYKCIKSLKKVFGNQITTLDFNGSFLTNFIVFKKRVLLSILCTFQFSQTNNNKSFDKDKDKFNTLTITFIHSVLNNINFSNILNNSCVRNV